MMEEHFMRSWNAGHDRFSADIDRGLKSLGRMLRRWIERAAPGRTLEGGADFATAAATDRAAKRAVPARASKRR